MNTAVAERTAHPIVVLEQQIDERSTQFAAALPAHIPVERFKRVVLTAVQNNPGLIKVERRSFFTSCMKAAQDGLLPDGREAALVEYNDKTRGLIAQYMPMIAGIRKKVRNSGEIVDWNAYVVYENDEFDYELGDNPFIRHKPLLTGERGNVIAAYSVATLKNGEKSREVMSIAEIQKVKNVSRAKNSAYGPWAQWFEEMARKTVARRHSKVLPMSTDLDDLIRRDDELYDLTGAKEEAHQEARRPSLAGMLDAIAEGGATVEHDAETGEISTGEQDPAEPGFGEKGQTAGEGAGTKPQEAGPAPTNTARPRGSTAEQAQADRTVDGDGTLLKDKGPAAPQDDAQTHWQRVQDARAAGIEAGKRPNARKNPPSELKGDGREDEQDAWLEGFDLGRSGEAEG